MNDPESSESTALDKLKKLAGPALGLIVFSIALKFLYAKLQETTWDELAGSVQAIPQINIFLAILLVAINYLVLTGNDVLGVAFAGGNVPYRRTALASFLGYALGNNVGAVIAGIPIRARFYGSWGMSPGQIASLVGFVGVSFWVGFWCFGGLVLSIVEVPVPDEYTLPVTTRVLGFLLLGTAAAYASLCLWWRRPLTLGGVSLSPPAPPLMWRQMLVASTDLAIVSTTLYILLPDSLPVSYLGVVAGYLVALAVTMISQVPGGLGVLESFLLTMFGLSDADDRLLGPLLVFRIFYYVIPLIVAIVILLFAEGTTMLRERKRGVTKEANS